MTKNTYDMLKNHILKSTQYFYTQRISRTLVAIVTKDFGVLIYSDPIFGGNSNLYVSKAFEKLSDITYDGIIHLDPTGANGTDKEFNKWETDNGLKYASEIFENSNFEVISLDVENPTKVTKKEKKVKKNKAKVKKSILINIAEEFLISFELSNTYANLLSTLEVDEKKSPAGYFSSTFEEYKDSLTKKNKRYIERCVRQNKEYSSTYIRFTKNNIIIMSNYDCVPTIDDLKLIEQDAEPK